MANPQKKSFWQQYGNLTLILSGVLIGTLIGVVIPDFGTTVKPIGDIFLNLLFTIVVPLVLVPIAPAMGSMTSMKRLGKILDGTIGTSIFTGAIADARVLVWANLFSPSADTTIELVASEVGEAQTVGELLVSSLTVSSFSDLWDESSVLSLIIFAILFDFCVSVCDGEQSPMGRLLVNLNDVIMKLVGIIMLVVPTGLGAYFANLMAAYGLEIIGDYGRSMLVYYPLCALYGVISFPLHAFPVGSRRSVAAMVKSILHPIVTAFAIQSSATTVPVNKETCDNIGVSKDVSDLVLSTGCTMHMDDSMLSPIIKIASLYGVFGMDFFDAGTYGMAVVVATLSAFVLSGVPRGGLAGEMLIISMLNFPVKASPIITTLGSLLDSVATCLDASGSTIASILVIRLVEGKEWLDKTAAAKKNRV